LKDLNLALAAAEVVAVPMPVASLIRDHFLTATARGYQWRPLLRAASIKASTSWGRRYSRGRRSVFFIRLSGNPAIFDGWGKIKGVSIRRILTLGEK
jgi:hypothetical protein